MRPPPPLWQPPGHFPEFAGDPAVVMARRSPTAGYPPGRVGIALDKQPPPRNAPAVPGGARGPGKGAGVGAVGSDPADELGCFRGRVKTFNTAKGYGFIDCGETWSLYSGDVFLHRQQFLEGNVAVGQEIQFQVELNKQGKPQARSVAPLGSPMPPGPRVTRVAPVLGNTRGRTRGNGQAFPGLNGADILEEKLHQCEGSAALLDVLKHHGHSFTKRHFVTSIDLLRLHRQREYWSAPLTLAFVDRLVQVPPWQFAADEASRALCGLAALDEVHQHVATRQFALGLGAEGLRRFHEFSPAEMADFVRSLAVFSRSAGEDELVGQVTQRYSDFALSNGMSMQRDELRPWLEFLQSAAAA